jgi:hypothetical protein
LAISDANTNVFVQCKFTLDVVKKPGLETTPPNSDSNLYSIVVAAFVPDGPGGPCGPGINILPEQFFFYLFFC